MESVFNPTFPLALLTVTKTWKQPKGLSTDDYLKKVWYACITKYLFNHIASDIPYMDNAWRQKIKQESWAQKGNY